MVRSVSGDESEQVLDPLTAYQMVSIMEGVVQRGAHVRLLRNDVVIHEGKLAQLKRLKDDAKEVTAGYECGMSFQNYQDMRAGDVIECLESLEASVKSQVPVYPSPMS